jgi:hypothetical protein
MSAVSRSVIDIPTERGITFSSIGIVTGLLLDDRDAMALLFAYLSPRRMLRSMLARHLWDIDRSGLRQLGTINVSCESVSYRHTDGERHNVLLDRYHNWTLT